MKPSEKLEIREKQAIDHSRPGCCLTAAELEGRIADWRLAGAGLIDVSQDSGDLVLHYRRDPEAESVLEHLVSEEQKCCSSLTFKILPSEKELTLRISGRWHETPWAAAAPAGVPAVQSDVREFVRTRYAALAKGMEAVSGLADPGRRLQSRCCGATYDPKDLKRLGTLRGVSLGCGNAIGAAALNEGETVLDLGSGAGLDVFVAAGRVGASGRVYGVDMTDEMLEVARANRAAAGLENVEFLKGYIEDVPLPEASVDVIISNCVINLSALKADVFAEIFRVLKPGGRLAVWDVVFDTQAPARTANDLDAWAGCLDGVLLTREQYRSGLEAAGLEQVRIQESHELQPGYVSVLVAARKPGALL